MTPSLFTSSAERMYSASAIDRSAVSVSIEVPTVVSATNASRLSRYPLSSLSSTEKSSYRLSLFTLPEWPMFSSALLNIAIECCRRAWGEGTRARRRRRQPADPARDGARSARACGGGAGAGRADPGRTLLLAARILLLRSSGDTSW